MTISRAIRSVVSAALAGLLIAGFAAPVSGRTSGVVFGADRDEYEIGEPVTIRLVNNSGAAIRMSKRWRIGPWRTDQELASYHWSEAERTVAPGEIREWTWDQLGPRCYGECQNVWAGEQVDAGRYALVAFINGRRVQDTFDIGAYFTLGFEGNEGASFVVFVAKQPEIDQMNEEAQKEDKTLIVSGKIWRGKPYNPTWSYIMGPRSIVLGEVFIEVCDAAPEYVEAHRDEWLGQRWCPWNSYVARAGR